MTTTIGVYAYFVVLDVGISTTPGKRTFGLRVQRSDGGTVTLRSATRREAFVLLGAVPFIGAVLALAAWIAITVTINSSPTNQGMHDRFSGDAEVVRDAGGAA